MSIVDYYEQFFISSLFYSMLAIMPLLEMIIPLRVNKYSLLMRWTNNFLLGIISGLLPKFLFPLMGVAFAVYIEQKDWGLFNLIHMPSFVSIILSIAILDFSRYLLHILMHHIPIFWSFHKIHHSDPDYDFTTGFRFHPLEALLGTVNTLTMIFLFGMPIISVIIMELLTVAIGFFVHTNIKLPAPLEKTIRFLIVTPNMHRIHHSITESQTNSNYSIVFPYWDYLGKTYTRVESVDQKNMIVGLEDCQGKKCHNFFWLIALPFLPYR